jgi:hypothetical protein
VKEQRRLDLVRQDASFLRAIVYSLQILPVPVRGPAGLRPVGSHYLDVGVFFSVAGSWTGSGWSSYQAYDHSVRTLSLEAHGNT